MNEIDVFVLQDGNNLAFRAYITPGERNRIIASKGEAESVLFVRTDERKIPQDVIEGKSKIEHILVPMFENMWIFLN
jgi:hypothetical protein